MDGTMGHCWGRRLFGDNWAGDDVVNNLYVLYGVYLVFAVCSRYRLCFSPPGQLFHMMEMSADRKRFPQLSTNVYRL